MLVSTGLKKVFWAEVVATVAYMINRFLLTVLGMKTPEEVWWKYPHYLDKLRLFGCLAYAQIRQDKVKPRALRCMFIGYPKGVKAYRLLWLEPYHMRCIISQDVVFNEMEMAFKKIDDVDRSTKISKEELEHEEIYVKVEHVDAKFPNLDEVK